MGLQQCGKTLYGSIKGAKHTEMAKQTHLHIIQSDNVFMLKLLENRKRCSSEKYRQGVPERGLAVLKKPPFQARLNLFLPPLMSVVFNVWKEGMSGSGKQHPCLK